jgi:hypothetical protein
MEADGIVGGSVAMEPIAAKVSLREGSRIWESCTRLIEKKSGKV